MTNGTETTAMAMVFANAVEASGAIVRVEPTSFSTIVSKGNNLVVVVAEGGIFSKRYQYFTSYKGLLFYAKSPQPITLTRNVEVVTAGKIWVPD
jgi:hypothetical protein